MRIVPAALLLLTVLLSYLINRYLGRWAKEKRIGAMGGGRHLHKGFIPTVGGVGILLSFYLGWGIFVWGTGRFSYLDQGTYGLLLGILIIHIIGMADDIRGISPPVKFTGSILAALAYVLFNPIFTELSLPMIGGIKLGGFAPLFSIIWIVGLTNAVNLIDGIDGLAGGVTVVILAGIAWFSFNNADFTVLSISLFFIAGIAGFLILNFPPAKIFMGDNGSLMLGFLLGTLPQRAVAFKNGYVNFAALIFLLMLPFFDTALAYFRRLLQGKNPFHPDKEHLHHRLLLLGLSQPQTLFIFVGFTVVYTLLSIKIYYAPPFKGLIFFLLGLAVFTVAIRRLGFVEKRRLYLPRWKIAQSEELILPPFFMKKVLHILFILLSDIGAILLSFFLYLNIKLKIAAIPEPYPFETDEVFLVLITAFWISLFYLNNLYQIIWDTSRVERFFQLARTTAFGILVLMFITLDLTTINGERIINFFIYWFLLTFFAALGRFIIVSVERGKHALIFSDKNALIVGSEKNARTLINDSKKRDDIYLNFIGVVSYQKQQGTLGNIKSLPLLINRYKVEEIVITDVQKSPEDVYDVVAVAEGMGVNFKITPELYHQLFRSRPALIGYPLIRLELPRFKRWQKAVKRTIDIFVSVLAIAGGMIPALLYSVYAKLKDGKVFYPEIVIGKFGKPLIIYKFNERAQNRSLADRVFYGLFFHKWTMFISVLIGQMSLVGPQLHGWKDVKKALRQKAAYRRRFLLKPGITGPAQMAGFYRDEKLSLEEEVENDIYYWYHLSLSLDLRIMFSSLALVFLKISRGVGND